MLRTDFNCTPSDHLSCLLGHRVDADLRMGSMIGWLKGSDEASVIGPQWSSLTGLENELKGTIDR
jgi:hypothetical protein